MAESAFFASKTELLSWVNSFFQVNLQKVEQCSNGALYCQIIDACHPGSVTMKKVNWGARAGYDSIPNYKILQLAFDRNGIRKHIEVDKLIRGRYQDNLEMLQWVKTYFDRICPGGEYDAIQRRATSALPDWVHNPAQDAADAPSLLRGRRAAGVPEHCNSGGPGARGIRGRGALLTRTATNGTLAGPSFERQRFEEEIVDLKITVDALETERDFYFQKLREIENLCQSFEAGPNPDMTVQTFIEGLRGVLYAKEDEEKGAAENDPA